MRRPVPRRLRPLAAAVLIALAATGLAAPTAGAQSRAARPCEDQPDFLCGTLTVPLDRSGRVGGSVRIKFAAQRDFPSRRRVLVALTGGPGQAGLDAASSFSFSLQPALRRYRLVTLDQRGTGESSVIRCDNVQRLRSLDPIGPRAVEDCAKRVGPKRVAYTTADTVLDLEALRVRLGADKLALMGISYGTHVALQYARAFPGNVDRLILDSIVGPDGSDAFTLDTYRNLPRVLREQCRGTRCRGITADPVADVAAIVQRLITRGPLQGRYFDARGRSRTTRYRTPEELAFLLVAGDLNPFLQAAMPAAFAAAARGDTALLMRLRRIGQGGHTPTKELSFGTNVTSTCLDVPLPYSLTAPLEARPAIAQNALAAVPPASYAPFDPGTILRASYVGDCLRWPQDVPHPPFAGPLPDVPALLLGGRADLRTPIENALQTAAQLPHSSVVALQGSGHDAIDNDITGCVARALDRFIGDRQVGTPCRGRDIAVAPVPQPPRSLRDFRSAPGVGGVRGRVVFAVLDTVGDARMTALQLELAGLEARDGGLRGGSFTGPADLDGRLRVRRYAYLRGLRVTGTLNTDGADVTGRVTVRGPRGTSGALTLTADGASGTLGGRAVRYRGSSGAVAAAAAATHRVGGGTLRIDPSVARRTLRRMAIRSR